MGAEWYGRAALSPPFLMQVGGPTKAGLSQKLKFRGFASATPEGQAANRALLVFESRPAFAFASRGRFLGAADSPTVFPDGDGGPPQFFPRRSAFLGFRLSLRRGAGSAAFGKRGDRTPRRRSFLPASPPV